MSRYSFRIVFSICLLCVVCCHSSFAQEEANTRANFDEAFGQWKQLLDEMRQLQAKA